MFSVTSIHHNPLLGFKQQSQSWRTVYRNNECAMNSNLDFAADGLLQEKSLELRTSMQKRVKGALVRSHFLNIRDMDAPSSFFFSLENTFARSKLMTSLKLLGGRVMPDQKIMRSHAVFFYSSLWSRGV